ncbi:MAG: hypothetical protein ACRDJX_02320, partial [Solirubrobacteraceae bacterium]
MQDMGVQMQVGKLTGPIAVSGLLALAGAGAAFASAATAASTVHKCGNKTESLEIPLESGEVEKLKVKVLDISAKGATCGTALKFLEKELTRTNATKDVEGYKCKTGGFKAPS